MPKISGREVLSESTEKAQSRLLLASVVAIISKTYMLPVTELKMLGMDLPAAIFDVSLLLLVGWYGYSYLVRWIGDLMAFRLWYSESSIWSEFGTNMKLDRSFIIGGIDALKAFNEYQARNMEKNSFAKLPPEKQRLYEDFALNAERYAAKLEHAGSKFTKISAFGHFYVWGQGLIIPTGVASLAVYLLLKYGEFATPLQF